MGDEVLVGRERCVVLIVNSSEVRARAEYKS